MISSVAESKALRFAQYLKEFVRLRSVITRDVEKYDSVLWFHEMPHERECRSPAWSDGFESSDPWLEVQKQQFPKPPTIPDALLPWIDQEAFRRATVEMPPLRQTKLEPDLSVEVGDGEEPPMIERRVQDYPDVVKIYEHLRPSWQAWSDEYRRREKIQRVYAELFHLHTQLQKQGEIVELVLGLGLLDWPGAKQKSSPIRRHVVTARVNLLFDSAAGIIRLEPPADGAQLRIEDDMLEAELRPERNQYASMEAQLKAIDDDVWDHSATFRAIKSWAEALHPDSQWSTDLQPVAGDAEKPAVSFAPALILRKRTQGGMVRIYDAIIHQLAGEAAEIPSGWGGLIEDKGDDEAPSVPQLAPGEASAILAPREIYFPLPANREQRRIVEAIESQRGVLVQGPPGTGKSHTIANLICHLLATGKRVLITAETGRALRVLKDKLPTQIQPLCVSLLGQSGDAFAELNSAVQEITTRFMSWSPGSYHGQIKEIDREISAKRCSIAEIDSELLQLRKEETSLFTLLDGAYRGTASKIAERVASERARYGWLQLPIEARENPPVGSKDVLRWLRVCRTYTADQIAIAKLRIIDADRLPSPDIFGAAVVAERDAKQAFEDFSKHLDDPVYQRIAELDLETRANLKSRLRCLDDRHRQLCQCGYEWIADALSAALGGRQAGWRALLDQSVELLGRIEKLIEGLQSVSISIPPELDLARVRADADALLNHLRQGGGWKRLGILTPKEVKGRTYLRHRIQVNGQPASSENQLLVVRNYVNVELLFAALEEAWLDHGGLPKGSQRQIRLAAIKEQVSALNDVLSHADECLSLAASQNGAFSSIPLPDWKNGQARKWLELISAAEIAERYRLSEEQVTACLPNLQAIQNLDDTHPVINLLVKAVAERDITGYGRAYDELRKIQEAKADQEFRHRIEAVLAPAIPGFVDAVARTASDAAWEDRFNDWDGAWRWAFMDNWLRKRSDFSYQDELWHRRQATERDLGELLAESAGLRAWSHFFNRLHAKPKEMAALRGWREAVRAMGKGTGRSARMERLRREARQYMDQCREAIPVWIMPRYLVAEMIDPAPNRYDLVIIDEASQLGIESLFLFYIARKMVVVGDDQQISPYGVGIPEQAIADLQHHYLEGIPHQHALSAQSSLYSNAKIRFGQNIVLREHFRCMPEIIQFSNDLCYASSGTPLDPLRSYPPDRLTPLVVRHVKDGYRSGSAEHPINEPEAEAVVAQIIGCIDDPRYADRTMGVISLQNEAQAKLIERKLLEALQPEIIEERRLICGDAYAFQGDERHIIFLSMVAASNERIGTLSNESARQRFNVAASRAQDQLWLFHSADLDVLSPLCMRYRLLSYMLSPTRRPSDEETQRFDSQFERDVFECIREKGFHVRTQVCVGDPTNHRYRIDLVVEGMQGRLAVECDGDEWHGPERYEQDMARQRDLERAGWRFVRVRGGDFYRDQAKALEPVWTELERLGIKPGGIDEGAAEPPPAAKTARVEREEADEIIAPREQRLINHDDDAAIGKKAETPLGPYVSYNGVAGPDPRTTSVGVVADGLIRVIEVEGPMLAKRAYDVYLRGCGIKRLGGELRSTMNKALASAIRQGKIVSENEPGKVGLIYSTVRIKGSPPVKPRCRGPRTFEEIPPGELRYAGRYILETRNIEANSDQHLRAILEMFDLKRLTTQVGTALLEILERSEKVDDEIYVGDAAPLV